MQLYSQEGSAGDSPTAPKVLSCLGPLLPALSAAGLARHRNHLPSTAAPNRGPQGTPHYLGAKLPPGGGRWPPAV